MPSPAKPPNHNHGPRHKARRTARYSKKMAQKVGLPPGTLVHIGEQKAGPVVITVMEYNEQSFSERTIEEFKDFAVQPREDAVTWINVDGLHRTDVMEKIGATFNIHPLVLEDIMDTNQRPKFEDFGHYVYIVLKMLYYNGTGGEVVNEQVSLILGPRFVISFQEQGKEGDVFGVIRDRLRQGKGRIRKMGADYLAYSLMDAVVDNYFVILENLGETIEEQEETLISNPTREALERIHNLRGEMLLLRRSVWPLREVINQMERGGSDLIHKSISIYLRDLYDNTVQVIDAIETYRDILASMMDIYLSSTSNRLNEVMKVLTMISTVFIPLTFIVGLYGMNFKYMPELESHWGYPMVWGVMILITFGMWVFFKKRKWL